VGKGNAGLQPAVTQGLQSNETALVNLAQTQNANSQSLFNESNPGFVSAENFYGSLASGDPTKIATAISPATQQIAQATAGAKANIMNNAPAGGEKNLALEQADVSQGAQVGQAATGSFLNSYNALATLAGQGTGESISAAGTGISGFGQANAGLGQLGNLQIQQKGAQLGAFTGLAGDVSTFLGTIPGL
jgi:hypothetical protein